MTDFDNQLRAALSDEDQKFLEQTLDETGYYKEVFSNLRGPGSALNIAVWVAVLVMSGVLIFCLISAFRADTVREQILYAALAIIGNSAQIAFQLWFNMRMNRRAIQIDIQKLKLAISRQLG